jgi:hypothetical protein
LFSLEAKPAAAPATEGDLEAAWSRIMEAVGQASQFTRTYLLQAHPVSLTATVLTIGFPPESIDSMDFVDNARNRKLIQDKVRDLGLGEVQVKVIKLAAGSVPARTAPVAAAPAPEAKPVSAPAPKPKKAPETKPEAAAEPKPEAKPVPATVLLDKDEFKNDPLIKQALEIFKGQILEVHRPTQGT